MSRETVRSLWRSAARRSVLVPLTVLAPLAAMAPTADHRYNVYWHGAMFHDNPLRIVPHTVVSLDDYLERGNFRPLGRMVEKSLDLLAFEVGKLLSVPVNVPFRLVSFLAAMVLTVVAVLFAESVVARGRLFAQAPSTLTATVPFAVAAGFVAAGSLSTVVLFGSLYMLSTALVLGVAALACRAVTRDGGDDGRQRVGRRRIGSWRVVGAVLAGMALASFNEIAYLALPLATAAVVVRGRWILGLSWRRLLTGRALRLIGLLWLGFLPVFLAVRAIIYGYCRDGDCYTGSDIVLGPAVPGTFAVRMISWLPPMMWQNATRADDTPWLVGPVLVAALLVLGWLGWRAARQLPRLTAVDRRQALGLAVLALMLLTLGAALGGLNGEVQGIVAKGRWGQGWRDTAITTAAGGLVVVAVLHALLGSARRWRWGLSGLLVLLVLLGSVSAAANKSYRDTSGVTQAALLHNRIAVEMSTFDRTAAGDARRCALRQEFRSMYPDLDFSLMRFDQSLTIAAREIAGRPFCSVAP